MYRIVLQAVLYFGEKHDPRFGYSVISEYSHIVLYDFLGTVKAAPHECVIRTGQP